MQSHKQQLEGKGLENFTHSLTETEIESNYQPNQKNAKEILLPKKIEAKIIQIKGENYDRTLAKNYLFSYVINKIQRNDCFEHSYLLFFVPALLTISRHLSMFTNEKTTGTFKLFILFIRRIQHISKQKPKQMDQAQLRNYVTVALRYRDSQMVKNTLRSYMEKNYLKMMGFMPAYGLYFQLLAHVDQHLQTNARMNDALELIKKTELQLKKYHNQSIQP